MPVGVIEAVVEIARNEHAQQGLNPTSRKMTFMLDAISGKGRVFMLVVTSDEGARLVLGPIDEITKAIEKQPTSTEAASSIVVDLTALFSRVKE